MRRSAGRMGQADAAPRLAIEPIDTSFSFKNKAYAALKNVIVSMDVYRNRQDIRLDERQLAQDFGISRTPVREAMAQLEREGFVRSVPRRGIYVVRKTRREVIEMITAWAALESMAARLITEQRDRRRDRLAAQDVRHLRKRRNPRASRRIFRSQYRVPPDHHPHERQRGADRARREPVHPHAHDPEEDDRRERPRRDDRSATTCTSSRRWRRATPRAPRTWFAIMRLVLPSMWRNTPITWIERSAIEGATNPPSSPGLSRRSRLGLQCARLSGMRGSSPRMTAESFGRRKQWLTQQ